MANRNVRYAGFAEGSGVLAPTFYVDANEVGLDSPTETEMEVPSSLGMTPRAKTPGPYISTGNIVYSTDIRTIPEFLRWGLNGYAFTAGPPVSATDPTKTDFNTHEVWADDQRYFIPFCSSIGKDEFEHVFPNGVVTSIEASVEREFVPFTVNVNAGRDQEGTLKDVETDILPNLPEEFALAYHHVSLFIDEDGTSLPIDVSSITKSLTFGFDNNVDSEGGVTIGSRYPRRHGSSGRSFTLTAEMTFENLDQKRAFWGATGAPNDLTGAKVFPVRIKLDSGKTFGAANNYGEAEILFPKVYFNAVPLTTSGRDEMTQSVAMTVLTGQVTLADAVTQQATAMYAKVKNLAGNLTL